MDKAEELLDSSDYQSLTFPKFYKVIEENLLFQLNGNLSSTATCHILEEMENICWMLCETKYVKKNNNDTTGQVHKLYDKEILKLLKVFNFLVELDEDDKTVVFPLTVDADEAQHVCDVIVNCLGLCNRKRLFSRKGGSNVDDVHTPQYVDFPAFLSGLEACFYDLNAMDLSQGIQEVSDQIIGDTIKKAR